LKIWSAACLPTEETGQRPGTISEVQKDRLIIACGEGSLAVTELQLEGKKRMMVKDFLLGQRLAAGEIFQS
jgi:methionyl-tRNA formyltransferase